MMRTERDDLFERLRRATCPEEVFGTLEGDAYAALSARYRKLAAVVHPDRNPDCVAEATRAFQSLQHWHAAARTSVDQAVYGRTERIRAVTGRYTYIGYEAPLHGDLCDLFPVTVEGARVLLKAARRARNNDLLQVEATTLRRLERELDGRPLRAHIPTLVEAFMLRDAAGQEREVNVVRVEAGAMSLEDVLRAYPEGLHPADAAWMFNRLVAALAVTHDLGIVHGAVVPAHVLIRPADHNGMLIDWCYSVATGVPLASMSPPYAADYPPEVHNRRPATAATDLYMAARCLLRLLGGDPVSAELPAGVPKPISALLRGCLLESPWRRACDAWQVFDDFQEILERLYGPRSWRPFSPAVPDQGGHAAHR